MKIFTLIIFLGLNVSSTFAEDAKDEKPQAVSSTTGVSASDPCTTDSGSRVAKEVEAVSKGSDESKTEKQ